MFNRYIYIFIYFLIFSFILSENPRTNYCWAQDNETETFLIAQKAFDDGFYDVAIRYISELLKQYPQTSKRPQIHLLLGQCHFFNGQYLDAFREFKQLLDAPGYKDVVLFWLGETYLKVKDYSEAEINYRQLLDLYPSSTYVPQAHYALAWIKFEKNDYLEAKENFQNFVALFPTHQLFEDSLFRIGECNFQLEQYEPAIETFQKYIKSFPKSTRLDQAFFYTAESNYYLKKYTASIKFYGKCKEKTHKNQTQLTCDIGIAWSYLKLKEFDQAEQSFKDAISFSTEKNITNEIPYFGLATLFSEKKDFTSALISYEKIISFAPKDPKSSEAYLGIANTFYKIEDYDKALDAYQKTIELFKNTPSLSSVVEKSYLGLAWTNLRKGIPSEAIRNFQYVIDQTQNKIVKVSALTQIGDAYQDMHEYDNAITAYDKILRNFPSTPYSDYAQYRQGIALLKMNKIDSATLSFESLQENFPDSDYLTDTKYYLGMAYFKKEDWIAAKENMENFISELSADHQFQPDAHYILGLSYLRLEDYEKSIKIFKKIKKYYPSSETLVQDSEINIARCLYEKGAIKDALKEFKIIIYKYPQTETALQATSWLAEYYLQSREYKNAITYYTSIIENFPDSDKAGDAIVGLAQAYHESGESDQALNQLKLINNSFNDEIYGRAHLLIAEIFASETDNKKAMETYQAIIKNSPEFSRDAYVKIARILKSKKHFAESLEAYENALLAPEGLSQTKKCKIQFLKADLYDSLGKTDKSIDAYLKIPYLYPEETKWVIKSYLRIARLFENNETWDEAVLIYDKILEYQVDERTFAQERLDWIQTNILANSY